MNFPQLLPRFHSQLRALLPTECPMQVVAAHYGYNIFLLHHKLSFLYCIPVLFVRFICHHVPMNMRGEVLVISFKMRLLHMAQTVYLDPWYREKCTSSTDIIIVTKSLTLLTRYEVDGR